MAFYGSGPKRTINEALHAYNTNKTPKYMRGHANKIRKDLERMFRLYSGKEVGVWKLDRSGGRCVTCTNVITGAKLLSMCPECGGTGYLNRYTKIGNFWASIDPTGDIVDSSEMGNSQAPPSGRDMMHFVGDFELSDDDLIELIEMKELYRVHIQQPQVVAMGGDIILQSVAIAFLTPGSSEYKLLGVES